MHQKGQMMTITPWIAIGAVVGLVIGNFAYQAMTGQNAWAVAADRSYFQALAVAGLMLIGWIGGRA